MGLLDLFTVASVPVLKVLVVTALGAFLALDHVNVLGEDARKHLNNIVFFVFNPALVGSNLANTITYESMVKLWFMPLNILITFIIGSALGWVVVQLTRAPPHLRGLVIGCCAAGNLGNMPLIIIPAVCNDKGSPFGAPDVCHTYGMAYASLSMAIGAIYLWSYVYNIVRVSSRATSKAVEIYYRPYVVSTSSSESSISEPVSCTEPLLSSKDLEDHAALPSCTRQSKAQLSIADKLKQHVGVLLTKINVKKLFTPSTTGAKASLLGVAILMCSGFTLGPGQWHFLTPWLDQSNCLLFCFTDCWFYSRTCTQLRKSLISDAAPLRVIQSSAVLVGDGAIPALTLIVGGNLLKGLRGPAIQKSLIVGIVAARYVVSPLTGIVVVRGALWFGLVHPNPLYQFVLLLQFALPPASNIGTITQLFGAGESECSVIMLWTYGLASIRLTLWSTLFMWLVFS